MINPTQVPAASPPPGRFAGTRPTETVDGAFPDVALRVSHAPPSAVAAAAVQLNAPVPPFLICTACAGGAPPVTMEKLTWPAISSKNGLPAAVIIRLTGTVMVGTPLGY